MVVAESSMGNSSLREEILQKLIYTNRLIKWPYASALFVVSSQSLWLLKSMKQPFNMYIFYWRPVQACSNLKIKSSCHCIKKKKKKRWLF